MAYSTISSALCCAQPPKWPLLRPQYIKLTQTSMADMGHLVWLLYRNFCSRFVAQKTLHAVGDSNPQLCIRSSLAEPTAAAALHQAASGWAPSCSSSAWALQAALPAGKGHSGLPLLSVHLTVAPAGEQ